MKICTLDSETTGLPPKQYVYEKDFMEYPYIVTFAYKIGDAQTQEFIVNQEGRKIPPEATKIHGITDAMAEDSEYTLVDVLEQFVLHAEENNYSVGHNIYFDTSMLKANVLRLLQLKRIDQSFQAKIEEIIRKEKRICTMRSSIQYCNLPGRFGSPKWPTLNELSLKLFGVQAINAHTSGGDVDTAYKCFTKLVELGVIKIEG